MRDKKLILIVLILLPSVMAQSELDFQIVEVSLDGDVSLDFTSSSSNVDYFKADLNLFPKDSYREEVLDFQLKHEPKASVLRKKSIEYEWEDDVEKLEFGYNSKVKVWNRIFQIPVDVPLENLGLLKEHEKYVRETQFIDITPKIREKAFEISEGSEGLYESTFKIAEWIRTNVDYDLNTLTEEVVQKSSWVLDNRFGVCDEITNLFVSFLRSRNIPVRYVVGIAYSDSVEEGWAPHAWAEVYFPGQGWIPWDVTFGQYGWIDTGHVKLSESIGAKDPSVQYTWRAVKVGLEGKNLELNSSIVKKGDKILPLVDLETELEFKEVKGSSFVPLEVTVKNLQNYYLSTLVFVTSAPGIVGDNTQAILLGPREEKKIKWMLSVPDLNGDFTYKSKIEVQESFGSSAENALTIDDKFKFYSKEMAEEILNGNFEEALMQKEVSGDFEAELPVDIVKEELEEENLLGKASPKRENILARFLRWLGWN
jgi:hypothetical protein